MIHQLILYVAGMAWGVLFGVWLSWIWRHHKPTPNPSQEGNNAGNPSQEGNDAGPGSDRQTWELIDKLLEQRRNREKMAVQLENQIKIAKAWRRFLVEQDKSALFVILGMGNSQSDLQDPRKMRRGPR